MNITPKPSGDYQYDVVVELSAEDLTGYVDEARRRIGAEVTIDGFRKGKAPQALVEKKITPSAIQSEALELALEGSFEQVVREQGWDVLRTTDLKVEKNDTTGLRYSIHVAVWPEVKLPDLTTIRVSRAPIEVSEADIDEAIDTLCNMRATFMEKSAPAMTGDRVEVDFDASVGGAVVEGGSSRNHPLVIGGKSFMPGFEDELVGLAPGQEKRFTIIAPADYYEPKLAGKNVDFTVTMRRVQSVLKPAADDAFAKSLGRFNAIEELRANVREGLMNEKRASEQRRIRLAILDAMAAAVSVPAPAEMVTSELDDMIHRFRHDLQNQGIDLSMYLARMKKTEDELRRDWTPEAQRQVRMTLLIRATAKEKSIVVSPEELDVAMNGVIAEMVRQGRATESQADPQRIRTALLDRMLTDRALEFLEGVCATG
ncbi:MAG: trigger factor [Candidatus Yanofskybacteria bacterium]|nr:trigger factor [Candidatus Yanofskybacteria bacterium]